MAVSVFEDKATMPDDKMLAKALGKSNRLWKEIEEGETLGKITELLKWEKNKFKGEKWQQN